MKRHLNITIANGIVVTGDTYAAKDVLRELGYKPQKVGYEWQHAKLATDIKAEIESLAKSLYVLARPAINQHLTEAAAIGFAPRPHELAWTITVAANGREAHYYALDTLTPAQYQNGRLVPVRR